MDGWMGPASAQGTRYRRLQRTHTAKTGTSDLHAELVALSSLINLQVLDGAACP